MPFIASRLILIVLIAGLAACASFKAPQNYPVVQLPYLHSSFNLDVAWNTMQTGNDTVIEGLIKNVRHPELQDIDLSVMVFDPSGRLLSKGFLPVPNNLKINESVPFSIKLKGDTIAQANILEFIIHYRASDDGRNGIDWLSSFKVDAATGVASLSSASSDITGEPDKELPLPVNTRQELDRTMQWLKSAIESISITLIAVDSGDENQYYSHYSFDNEGCSVKFSHDFNYYDKLAHERKTMRIGSSVNLKDIGNVDVAPFYLTHMYTTLYSVYGNSFSIPVKNAVVAKQIAIKLVKARRLCGATTEMN
jgi:hypothetical protein